MEIEDLKILIQDIVHYDKRLMKCSGYIDKEDNGVYGMGGQLNIRPPYQREFIYDPPERDAVINSVRHGYPLNGIYWSVSDDGHFEMMDGQQRTISIAQYVAGDFSVDYHKDRLAFHNLTENQQEQILNYRLTVYLCRGTEEEKLEWFRIINIQGKPLSKQELLNAVYKGPWVSNAKRYFTKPSCAVSRLYDRTGHNYLSGKMNRGDYLGTVIKWVSGGNIESYMSDHQHNDNAEDLWEYFENVIKWIESIFSTYRKEMQGLDWGLWYNEYKDNKYDPIKIEKAVDDLMQDEEVDKKKGVYEYIFTGDEKHLNLRLFSKSQGREAYEKQKEICVYCGKHFNIDEMEADHITPWSKGGKTVPENCQMLCLSCNRKKGAV